MKRVYVFDADDTGWMNEWQYSETYIRFFHFLYGAFKDKTPNLYSLVEQFKFHSKAAFDVYGVKNARQFIVFEICYEKVRAWVKNRFNEDLGQSWHLDYLRNLGKDPFDFTRLSWLPETRAALLRLKNEGHALCLLSCYDSEFFPARTAHMKTEEFFPLCHTRCTEFKKTKDDFIAVSGWTPEKDPDHKWIAVGNAESDILPALEISESWHGIYIPHSSTSVYVGSEKGVDYFTPPPISHPRVRNIFSARDFPFDFPA